MKFGDVELYNVVELVEPEVGAGKFFTRVPNELRLTLNESARERALCTAGSEIRFNLESGSVKVVLQFEGEAWGFVELYQGPFQVSTHEIGPTAKEVVIEHSANSASIEVLVQIAQERKAPFDARLTRVLLPHWPQIRLLDICTDGARITSPRGGQTPQLCYLAYGSSITHGLSATRPTGGYAMRTAQLLGVELINLGFGGGARCEPQMADYIAQRTDWDFATLELGVNMLYGFEVEDFSRRVRYFVERIARANVSKWIFCIDIFTLGYDLIERYDCYNMGVPPNQDKFRQVVRSAAAELGLPNLIHIDGREIFNDPFGLTADLVHPAPSGMELMAQNLTAIIRPYLHKTPK